MSDRGSRLPPDEERSKVADKLRLLNSANIDSEMKAGQFRFFARVLQQLDLRTWTSTLSDDRLCAELPDCRNRFTANSHRTAIRDLGYWQFDPGSGRHPTRYFLASAIPDRVLAELETKKLAIQEARLTRTGLKRDVVSTPRKAASTRGPQTSDTVVHRPPVHITSSHSQHARRLEGETPREEQPSPLCSSCWKPADREGRTSPKGDALMWCEECAGDLILMDERPIPQFDPDADDAYLIASRG